MAHCGLIKQHKNNLHTSCESQSIFCDQSTTTIDIFSACHRTDLGEGWAMVKRGWNGLGYARMVKHTLQVVIGSTCATGTGLFSFRLVKFESIQQFPVSLY